MAGVEPPSEFDGGGVMPNTVYPKGPDALTNSDKLRLQSITGQETDSQAKPDPWFWQGGQYHPDALAQIEEDRRARQQKNRQIRRDQRDRYRESPY